MRHLKNLALGIGLGFVLAFPLSGRAQVEDFITGTSVNFLHLDGSRLHWKADCQSGFPNTRIYYRSLTADENHVIYAPSPCSISNSVFTELDVDGAYAYWLNAAGQVRRMDKYYGGPPTLIATTPGDGALSINGQVAVSPGYVFWTEEFGEFRDTSIIYRCPKTPGAFVEIVRDYSSQPLAYMKSLYALNDTNIFYLLGDGRVINLKREVRGAPPFTFFVWEPTTISAEATALFLTSDRIYWVDASSDRKSAFFRSSPITDVTNERLDYLAFRTTAHDVVEFVVNEDYIFFQDLTSSSAGPFMRKDRNDSNPAVEIAGLTYRLSHLSLNSDHLIWRKNNTTISRLSIAAPPVTRDLQATGMEVVQVIQNASNQNPLVAGKPTFVRLFGRIASSSAGETNLSFWPIAALYGEQGGAPLRGSPLTPFQNFPLKSTAPAREDASGWFLFRLPDEWTRLGAIRLRGVINPNRVLPETSYANNTRTYDTNFFYRPPVGMVMYPTLTHRGAIFEYNPSMQQTFDYIEALLPTSDLIVRFVGGLIEEPYDPAHWIGDGGPFEVSEADDDGWTVLTELTLRKVFSGERYAEALGGFDHYVAMLRRQADMPEWSGYAHRGDDRIPLNMIASTFFEERSLNGVGAPFAAVTQCQELAHNYGRLHVDCGDPDSTDPFYPYATDTLSSTAAGYIGFNPFTRALILPDDAADFMSYCGPKWTSDYTWKALFNLINHQRPPAVAAAALEFAMGPGAGTRSLIAGYVVVDHGIVALKQALPLTGAQEYQAAQAIIGGQLPHPNYEIRAFAGDELRATYPIYFTDAAADEGAHHSSSFIAIANLETGWDSINFINKSNPAVALASLYGGVSAPVVNVLAPTAGQVISREGPLTIRWTGSDPNNDTLVYSARFSSDGGATWQMIASGTPNLEMTITPSGLRGSQNCIIEVIASDGILTSTARSQPFTLAQGTPRAFIFTETPRGRNCDLLTQVFIPAGEPIIFHGRAHDDEDGDMPGASLAWVVTGPVSRSGNGRQFQLDDLAPGNYNVRLTASDTAQQTGIAQMTLTVDPHYVENSNTAIVLDGEGNDPAYLADKHPLQIRYSNAAPALVRMVHQNGSLYICASGLRAGTDSGSSFGVVFDVNNSGGSAPQVGDLMFEVSVDGRIRTLTGNGSIFVQDAQVNGLQAEYSIHGAVAPMFSVWSAELRIDMARLGGWNGQTVGLAIGHLNIDLSGERSRYWPVNTAGPSTWADTVLGPDPNDPTDSDRDGMPDRWELSIFGNLTQKGDADYDGDRLANADEYIAGTNPNNGKSVLAVQIQRAPSGIRLFWPNAVGRTYAVLGSDDLRLWDTVATGIGTGQWLAPSANPANFYRVEVCSGR